MAATTDVVIVGGGPVGAILALSLAQAGVEVTLLERDLEISTAPRAMVYFGGAIEVLADLGVVDEMLERGFRDDGGLQFVVRSTGDRVVVPNTAMVGLKRFPFNVHLGQGELVEILDARLGSLPNATILRGAEVTGLTQSDDAVTVAFTRDGEPATIDARYAVGADGGRSAVRTAIGATLDGTTWDQRFVATNVRFDFDRVGFLNSNMHLDAELGCIIARISRDGLWRCTYQESVDLDEATVADRAPAFFEKLLGPEDAATVEIVAVQPYRMHQRIASTLRDGRVLLAGDAAHLTNPTGGMGLTSGIYDVEALSEALVAVVRDGADDEILDRYAAVRTKAFVEFASPRATRLKGLVYDADGPTQALTIAGIGALVSTVEGQREFLGGNDALRSASLVDAAR